MTTDLKRHIRKRDRLFKLAKEVQSNENWARWKYQRNLVTSINRRLKNEYIHREVQKLLQQKQNLHKYHKTLRAITGRTQNHDIPPLLEDGSVLTDDQEKATLLNDYFARQSTLDIPDARLPPPNTADTSPATTLEQITTNEHEVLQILNSLNPNKSTGPDGLPVKFLKLTALLIAKPLSQLFNKSLSQGIYPEELKKANIKPIFKNKGSPSDPTCYRPISILSAVSKVFEKIVYKNLYRHITDNALLTEKQSGYRKYHSTEIQLHYLTHNLYASLDTGLDFTAIYLDISKYFDKIWNRGLLHKCQTEFGISGTLLHWLKSYLSNRTQRVQIRNSFSRPSKINAGCPQGSVLGPILALMYLNDLSNRTYNDILFFADDTSIFASHSSQTLLETEQTLQHDLDEIHKYGQKWAITFNSEKTIQQTFSLKSSNQQPNLVFANTPIPTRETHKHLGMTFSVDLRFHEHVNVIIHKVNKTLSPLYAIAKHLPRHILEQIYKTYILPHFDNCDTIYDGHITLRDISRLETLQNRIARLTTGTLFRTSSDKLRRELGWDKLTTRRKIHRLTLYHKLSTSSSDGTPTYITDIIPNTRAHDTSMTLRNAQHHTQIHAQTTTHQRSFFSLTTKQWNDLPEASKQLSHSDFKKWIKHQYSTIKPPIFYSIGSKILNIFHTRLRTDMSQLNAHMYKIQKSDTPACPCGFMQENTSHFILTCPKYTLIREELFQNVSQVLQSNFLQKPKSIQLEILLHGTDLGGGGGRAVARLFQNFLRDSHRFTYSH